MRFLALFLFSCLVSFFPVYAQAQGHSSFCGKIDSTAASQECLKKHLESAQKRLNEVYQKLAGSLEGEKLAELKDLQKTWLLYRDSECMWEAARPETPSLKRVNELSCMARVTEDRADLLTIAYGEGGDINTQHEFGSFPRWMNVVTKDVPDIFWQYGRRASYDLTCDGREEHVMLGISTSPLAEEDKTEPQKSDLEEIKKTSDKGSAESEVPELKIELKVEPKLRYFSQEITIAIAQDVPVGRPKVQVFTFPVMDAARDDVFCQGDVSFYFEERVPPKEQNTSMKESAEEGVKSDVKEECRAVLRVNDKECSVKNIIWTGKEFALDREDALKEEPKETK